MTDDSKRTVLAQEAFKFSDIFAFKFMYLSFGSPMSRRLKLAPLEMSTDGGRKARQPIVLSPDGDGASLVVGWVDVPQKTAELKSFTLQSQQYELRYAGELIDIQREEYDRAIAELQGFFRIQQIAANVVQLPGRTAAPAKDTPAAEPERPSAVAAMIAMLVIGIAIGFGLGYLVFHLRVAG